VATFVDPASLLANARRQTPRSERGPIAAEAKEVNAGDAIAATTFRASVTGKCSSIASYKNNMRRVQEFHLWALLADLDQSLPSRSATTRPLGRAASRFERRERYPGKVDVDVAQERGDLPRSVLGLPYAIKRRRYAFPTALRALA
jgi:hypothetical protein